MSFFNNFYKLHNTLIIQLSVVSSEFEIPTRPVHSQLLIVMCHRRKGRYNILQNSLSYLMKLVPEEVVLFIKKFQTNHTVSTYNKQKRHNYGNNIDIFIV